MGGGGGRWDEKNRTKKTRCTRLPTPLLGVEMKFRTFILHIYVFLCEYFFQIFLNM